MSPRDHNHFQDLLEKQIAGEPLSPDARMELFDHIETCDACRDILEAEERLTARMKTVPRLVAPSDLRSKIVSKAARDHRERTTTPSEDPTVSDLLNMKTRIRASLRETNDGNQQSSARNRMDGRPTDSAGSARTRGGDAVDELPVFAGTTAPSQRRLRRVWRRASPVLAGGFLLVAGTGALYTGQFSGIPFADDAQKMVWSLVDSAVGHEDPYQLPQRNSPKISQPTVETAKVVIEPASVAPLPGTETVTGWITNAKGWIGAVDSTIGVLAQASTSSVPDPAEKLRPQIAALVLKPTVTGDNPGGFKKSVLADALQSVARMQPGGKVSAQDQFAMNGHRFRLYTLDLPAGCTHRIIETLMPYQSPTDGQVVNALTSQKEVEVGRDKAIQFYSGNEKRLKSALETITPVSSTGPSERIRVVVVE